jgi:hypothetical protein
MASMHEEPHACRLEAAAAELEQAIDAGPGGPNTLDFEKKPSAPLSKALAASPNVLAASMKWPRPHLQPGQSEASAAASAPTQMHERMPRRSRHPGFHTRHPAG